MGQEAKYFTAQEGKNLQRDIQVLAKNRISAVLFDILDTYRRIGVPQAFISLCMIQPLTAIASAVAATLIEETHPSIRQDLHETIMRSCVMLLEDQSAEARASLIAMIKARVA